MSLAALSRPAQTHCGVCGLELHADSLEVLVERLLAHAHAMHPEHVQADAPPPEHPLLVAIRQIEAAIKAAVPGTDKVELVVRVGVTRMINGRQGFTAMEIEPEVIAYAKFDLPGAIARGLKRKLDEFEQKETGQWDGRFQLFTADGRPR